MKMTKENIKFAFVVIGLLWFGYVAIADANPKQAVKEIQNGNYSNGLKNHYSNCDEILDRLDRVGLLEYWTNEERDSPPVQQHRPQDREIHHQYNNRPQHYPQQQANEQFTVNRYKGVQLNNNTYNQFKKTYKPQ